MVFFSFAPEVIEKKVGTRQTEMFIDEVHEKGQ